VLRLLTLLFTTLLVGLPLTASAASAAPAPSTVHASQSDDPADDAEADDADPADDDAEADDSFDLSAYCSALDGDDSGDDAADDSGDDTITIDLGVLDTLDPDAQDDPEDADDGADDSSASDEDCADESSADSTPSSGTRTASVADMLKTGTVNTGTVTMSGPGTITQELWLPAVAPAKRGLRAVGTSKASAKIRKGKAKTTAKARKATGRTLGGRVTRIVTRAGVVNLKVTLNAAARKLLRSSKKDVRITVKTTTRVKGGKPQFKNGTLVAHRKAAK
jgi:hypothetical protein